MLKLLKVLCFPPCYPRNIIEYLAFQPPAPSYTVDNACSHSSLKVRFKSSLDLTTLSLLPLHEIKCNFVTTKHSSKICCMYYASRNPQAKTILYSHGNASDLGTTMQLCVWIALNVRCNILAYDYSGYGRSTGKPSEKRMYSDIEAAFNLLLDGYNCPPEDIVLLGQSLGSVPTIHLASQVSVRGVVIQSGIASALNVVFGDEEPRPRCCDVFKNISLVSEIQSPVLVIHGTEDQTIDLSHGIAIYERAKCKVTPLWLTGGDHNDLEFYPQFFDRLEKFINYCK